MWRSDKFLVFILRTMLDFIIAHMVHIFYATVVENYCSIWIVTFPSPMGHWKHLFIYSYSTVCLLLHYCNPLLLGLLQLTVTRNLLVVWPGDDALWYNSCVCNSKQCCTGCGHDRQDSVDVDSKHYCWHWLCGHDWWQSALWLCWLCRHDRGHCSILAVWTWLWTIW